MKNKSLSDTDMELFKVQVSVATTASKPQILIYNEDQSLLWQGEADSEAYKLMGKRKKAYLYGFQNQQGKIMLNKGFQPDPGW